MRNQKKNIQWNCFWMVFEATNCIIVVFDNQKYFDSEEYFNCENRAQQLTNILVRLKWHTSKFFLFPITVVFIQTM